SNIRDETGADAEYERLERTGIQPWILAVKMREETAILHARAYLQNPPPHLVARGLSTLPSIVRKAIADLPGNIGGGFVVMNGSPRVEMRAPTLLQRVKESLSRDPNVLLIGPPGTGKTVILEDLRAQFLSEAGTIS